MSKTIAYDILNASFADCVATGQTLTGSKDQELDALNADPAKASHAWHGAYGLICHKTAGAFLALAHKLEQRPLLWHFMSAGFAEGFSEMATRLHERSDFDHAMVRLASGLQAYPDLLKIMKQSLQDIGVDLRVKSCRTADGRKFCAVAIQDEKDIGNAGYVIINGDTHVIAVDDLGADDKSIKDLVISLVMTQQREIGKPILKVA